MGESPICMMFQVHTHWNGHAPHIDLTQRCSPEERDERHASRTEHDLRLFNVVEMMSDRIAVRAAANYRSLRRRGIAIRSTIDMIVGTYCIERGHEMLHDDRDFTPMVKHLCLREFRA